MLVRVLGSGIFGVAGALELARRGHEVTLSDPGPVPHVRASSTDISKVVRLEYGADVFYTELMERALDGWRELNATWERPLFHETGFVVLAKQALKEGTFELDSLNVLSARGHAVDRLDRASIGRRFPPWSERYVDGYFNPQGGWAESGQVVAELVKAAQAAGVTMRAERLDVDEASSDADLIIVAAGAWTPMLVPELSTMMRVVGQPVMHFAPQEPEPFQSPRFVPWAADISRTGWYGFCANAQGIVKVANHGAGLPMDPEQERLVPNGTEARFRAFLQDALPELARAKRVSDRLCLYCDTIDGDLWIGRHPSRDRIMVAAGGSGHGFKFAPILGELIADEAEGKTPSSIADRFGWRVRDHARLEGAQPDAVRFEEARFSETD